MACIVRLLAVVLVGLPAACLGSLLAPFLYWSETNGKEPRLTRYGDAFCEFESSLTTGRFTRESAAIIANTRSSEQGGLDFRGIDDQWERVCLTSIVSGEPMYRMSELHAASRKRLRRICWEWSEKFLTLMAVRADGAALPMKFPVRQTVGMPKTATFYGMMPSSDRVRQCSSRVDAIATCRPITSHQGPESILTFGN